MQAGKLRNSVNLQQPASDSDDYGQPLTTWIDVTTLWADIRHVSGLAAIKAGAETSIVKASVRIRFRDGVTAGMRIMHGTTAYNITAVLPDVAKREFVDLVCEVVK